MKNNKISLGKFLIYIIIIIAIIGFISALVDNKDSSTTSTKTHSNYNTTSTETYSNYHKCEYPGCDNYASKTKYCSKHNQTTCSRAGCKNKEAYQGSGLCREHLYQSIQDY